MGKGREGQEREGNRWEKGRRKKEEGERNDIMGKRRGGEGRLY